jgi:hypothetical protein
LFINGFRFLTHNGESRGALNTKFRLPAVFKLTALVAAYAAIPRIAGNDTQFLYLLFLVVTLVGLVSTGPLRKRPVVISAVIGWLIGSIVFAFVHHSEHFHPKDMLFYFVLYATFASTAGTLLGFIISKAQRT